MVCRAAVRHRRRLQDLRREFPGPEPSEGNSARCPARYREGLLIRGEAVGATGNCRRLIAQRKMFRRLRPVAPVRYTPDLTRTAELNFGRHDACDHAEITRLHAVLAS